MTTNECEPRVFGTPTKCAYCGRTGRMIFVPDGHLPDAPRFGPIWACNQQDCTGYDFYDMPPGELGTADATEAAQ